MSFSTCEYFNFAYYSQFAESIKDLLTRNDLQTVLAKVENDQGLERSSNRSETDKSTAKLEQPDFFLIEPTPLSTSERLHGSGQIDLFTGRASYEELLEMKAQISIREQDLKNRERSIQEKENKVHKILLDNERMKNDMENIKIEKEILMKDKRKLAEEISKLRLENLEMNDKMEQLLRQNRELGKRFTEQRGFPNCNLIRLSFKRSRSEELRVQKEPRVLPGIVGIRISRL